MSDQIEARQQQEVAVAQDRKLQAVEPAGLVAAEPAADRKRSARVYGVIACQGDSLTYGSRDPDGMSYPVFLGRLLSRKHNQTWATIGFGVPGDGWAEIWRRNYRELLSVLEAGEVCLWAGTNDAKNNRSVEQTLAACEAVLDQCQALGRLVYLATLPGKTGFGAPREPWSMNRMVEQLNASYREIAQRRGAVLVELADLPRDHFVDGLHLSQSGNVWVAEIGRASCRERV